MQDTPFAPPESHDPYALGDDALERIENATLPGHFARFMAYLIDGTLSIVPAYLVALPLLVGAMLLLEGLGMSEAEVEGVTGLLTIPFAAVVYVFAGVYFAAFESSSLMATPGKLLFGLKVVKSDGQPLTFVEALGRGVLKMFLLGMCSFLALVVLLDDNRQGPWGSVTRSRVIKPA